MNAYYDLALMLMNKNSKRSADLFKKFIEDCKKSDQYENDNSQFKKISDYLYNLANKGLFTITSESNNKDLYDKEVAKKAAAEYIKTDMLARDFTKDLKSFAEHLLYEENDDDGFRLLLKTANRLDGFHEEAKNEMLQNMNYLDTAHNGIISRILDADEDGEFDVISRAMRDGLDQSDDPGFDNC